MPIKRKRNLSNATVSQTETIDISSRVSKKDEKDVFRNVHNQLRLTNLTPKQIELINILNDPKKKIIIISGPAGTAKTFSVCYYAIKSICEKTFEKVILTKPLEEAGEKVGYLPGDLADKINPFFSSFKSNLEKMIKPDMVNRFFEKKNIEYQPLAFMRGNSYDNTLQVLDESQNSDIRQIILFATRMGKGSKVVIMGDEMQYDIPGKVSGLKHFRKITNNMEGVAHFEFVKEDIMRDEILIELTDRYEKYVYDSETCKTIENKKNVGK